MQSTERALQNKMNMLPCILKAVKYEKQKPYLVDVLRQRRYIWYLADVSSWLPCVINLWRADLFWATNFGFAASLSNPQICSENLLTFRDKLRVYISREAVSKLSTWSLPCCDKTNLEFGWKNNKSYHWLQDNYLWPIRTCVTIWDYFA